MTSMRISTSLMYQRGVNAIERQQVKLSADYARRGNQSNEVSVKTHFYSSLSAHNQDISITALFSVGEWNFPGAASVFCD